MRGHPQRELRCFISITARIRSGLGPFGPGFALCFEETAAGIFDEPARDRNSTGLTVSPRLPTEPAVLAEQVERTIQRSAGPMPGDSVPGGNDSKSAIGV